MDLLIVCHLLILIDQGDDNLDQQNFDDFSYAVSRPKNKCINFGLGLSLCRSFCPVIFTSLSISFSLSPFSFKRRFSSNLSAFRLVLCRCFFRSFSASLSKINHKKYSKIYFHKQRSELRLLRIMYLNNYTRW